MKKQQVFIDMDGVVAEWNLWATMANLRSYGYFRRLAPVMWMLNVSLKLYLSREVEVYILSKVLSKHAENEKGAWLDMYMPYIDKEHRIFVPNEESKVEHVKQKMNVSLLNEDMILLDDYSPNLHEWAENGGKTVKVMNGFNGNHGTYTGPRISEDDLSALEQLLN